MCTLIIGHPHHFHTFIFVLICSYSIWCSQCLVNHVRSYPVRDIFNSGSSTEDNSPCYSCVRSFDGKTLSSSQLYRKLFLDVNVLIVLFAYTQDGTYLWILSLIFLPLNLFSFRFEVDQYHSGYIVSEHNLYFVLRNFKAIYWWDSIIEYILSIS